MKQSNLDKLFKADSAMEKDGVDFVISDTTSFRVRRFVESNPQVQAAMATHYKPVARQIAMGSMDQTKEREVMTKIFVNACLVGWKGVEMDGQPVEFSKEKAVELLLGLPDLFKVLFEHAQKLENYREELGNS